MLFKGMELVGCKGLKANNINHFIYNPTSPYQLILGTNGSGKSSVMREITPLPGMKEDFLSHGRKVTWWEHLNNDYELTSTFKGAGKHSFLKNGEELNPGGTLSIQKELVESEFGWTFDLRKILTLETRFSELSPTRKRELLTTLTDSDLTFALDLYTKLVQNLNTNKGALKHLTGRLARETENLMALDTGEDLDGLSKQIREELNVLFTSRGTSHLALGSVEGTLAKIERLSKALVIGKPVHPAGMQVSCFEDILEHVQNADRQVLTTETTLKSLKEQYHDLEELVRTLEASGADGVESLQQKLQDLQSAQRQLGPASGVYPEQLEAASLLESSQDAIPQLIEIFSLLPDNSDRTYTGPKLVEAREQLKALEVEVSRIQSRLAQAETQLEHMHDATKVDCPNCKHIWIPGYSESRKAAFERQREECLKTLETLQVERKRIDQYIELAVEYSQLYARYSKGLTRSYPKLIALWDYIMEHDAAARDPKSWIPKFYAWLRDLELWARKQQLESQTLELTHALETASKIEGSTQLSQRLERLQEAIEIQTNAVIQHRETLVVYTRHMNTVSQYLDLYREFSAAETDLESVVNNEIERIRRSEVESAIDQQHTRLSSIQSKLQAKQSLHVIVEDLKASRAEVEQDVEAYRLLVSELSPTEGLIAEQLRGFIETFTGHVNSIINKVWTYELSLLPCGYDSGELDYVFPLQVKNDSFIVDDAKKWSAGQRDIVDFAFLMVYIFYRKLKGFPLLLDELGATFDPEHRHAVMNFVKSLLETGGFNQVFLVSHYASSHGAFSNAEVLVMDADNISTPDVYNKHVVFG